MSFVYLPSTPWNLYLSVAHALHQGGTGHRLLLLDQRRPSPYVPLVREGLADRFVEVEEQCVHSGALAKWRQRRDTFALLDRWLQADEGVEGIAVGSDRRVEFQYAMAQASRRRRIDGHYLDDGLYSYLGRPWRPVKDRLDGLLKKAAYGRWWQTPPTIGASGWITDAWLWMPEAAVSALQRKRLHRIEAAWFRHPRLTAWVERVLAAFGVEREMLQGDLLLLLTHPNNARKMPGYVARMQQLAQEARRRGLKVMAKYHPRVGTDDPFEMKRLGVQLLPAGMVFEFVLPLLPDALRLVGDVSTTVLSARWLRPDLRVFALLDAGQPFQQRVVPVLAQSGAQIIEPERMEQCIS